MRYHEIASGVQLPVSSEEKDVLDRADTALANDDLSEREQEVARLMASRGLLIRSRQNGRMVYRANALTDVWRDRDAE